MSHPREALDELLQHAVRLSVMGALSSAQELEFGFLREQLLVSDSVLSRQLSRLERVGYVHIRKGYVGKRPRTWLSITELGADALARHVEALREIVAFDPRCEPKTDSFGAHQSRT
ncbi:MAG: winged helix-turn-helix domain-containing protein [Acidimicrobiales bacterium]